MATETDYKRLWRNAKQAAVEVSNLLMEANAVIKSQADLIRKLRDGTISKEELEKIKIEVKDNIKNYG